MRAAPAMATSTPPPTAAMNKAMPSGTDPSRPKNFTCTYSWFCRMKAISRISTTSAQATAAQTIPARVTWRVSGAGAGAGA